MQSVESVCDRTLGLLGSYSAYQVGPHSRYVDDMLRLAVITMSVSLLASNAQAQTHLACCDNAAVSGVVKRMLKLHQALVSENNAASQLHAMAREVRDDASLPQADRDALVAIQAAAERWKDKPANEIRDRAFPELSRWTVFLALRHEGGTLVVTEATCPAHGSWLQASSSEIQSPWIDCGSWP